MRLGVCVIAVLASLTLAACGGGGGSDKLTQASLERAVLAKYTKGPVAVSDPVKVRCSVQASGGYLCDVTGIRNPPGTDAGDGDGESNTNDATVQLLDQYGGDDTPEPRLVFIRRRIQYADPSPGREAFEVQCRLGNEGATSVNVDGMECTTSAAE